MKATACFTYHETGTDELCKCDQHFEVPLQELLEAISRSSRALATPTPTRAYKATPWTFLARRTGSVLDVYFDDRRTGSRASATAAHSSSLALAVSSRVAGLEVVQLVGMWGLRQSCVMTRGILNSTQSRVCRAIVGQVLARRRLQLVGILVPALGPIQVVGPGRTIHGGEGRLSWRVVVYLEIGARHDRLATVATGMLVCERSGRHRNLGKLDGREGWRIYDAPDRQRISSSRSWLPGLTILSRQFL